MSRVPLLAAAMLTRAQVSRPLVYRIAFIHGDMRMGYAATMSLFLGLVNIAVTLIVFKTLRTESA